MNSTNIKFIFNKIGENNNSAEEKKQIKVYYFKYFLKVN